MTHTVSLSTSGITSLTKALIYNDHTPPRKYFLVLIFNKMIGMTHETNPWINESNWSTCWFIFSCGPPTWVIFVWVLSPSCPHRSYLWYWWKSSGSSMKFSESLQWTVMRPEFIVGYWKFWSRYECMFSNPASMILYSFVSSKNSSSLAYYLMCSSCASIRWVA